MHSRVFAGFRIRFKCLKNSISTSYRVKHSTPFDISLTVFQNMFPGFVFGPLDGCPISQKVCCRVIWKVWFNGCRSFIIIIIRTASKVIPHPNTFLNRKVQFPLDFHFETHTYTL